MGPVSLLYRVLPGGGSRLLIFYGRNEQQDKMLYPLLQRNQGVCLCTCAASLAPSAGIDGPGLNSDTNQIPR
ncbi:hypothetical protein AV530_011106 [Patagioenas fasciata monilis]|uniref:Uncharacterized protein n=1 Tax=Patagioenas fasciata monilis TaxID=372326 RepID=A0A1V4JXE9_PATFA|nr:hypothetical protein AV530_011106 [Patagioenas fasciata monilis]